MKRMSALLLTCTAWFSSAGSLAAAEPAFAEWAASNVHEISLDSGAKGSDLEPLRKMIGSASLVSFGEGLHGSAEPLDFRNRLFRFLVEGMGFTAIAIESGITESYPVDAYVQGAPGDPKELASRGITSGLGDFPQQAQLIRWMREYNLDARHARKIHFYGMDVSGFPGRPAAPLDTALEYLDVVEPAAARALRQRIQPMLPLLDIDRFSDKADQYSRLPQDQRDAATATIADLIVLYETKEGAFIHATSKQRYELAYRAALAARQVDEYLRQVPVGWSAQSGPQSIMGTVAVADRAKLENIEWIRQQETGGRVLVFSHLGHAATTPVSIRLTENEPLPLPPLVGTYLKRRHGDDLVTIGHLFAHDTTDCTTKRDAAAPTTLEGMLASLQKPAFILDLRSAPAAIRAQLSQLHDLYGQRPTHSLRIDEGIDVLFFTQRATRSLPCPSGQGAAQ